MVTKKKPTKAKKGVEPVTVNNDYVVLLQKLLTAIDWVLRTPTKEGAIPADSSSIKALIEVADEAAHYLVE